MNSEEQVDVIDESGALIRIISKPVDVWRRAPFCPGRFPGAFFRLSIHERRNAWQRLAGHKFEARAAAGTD